MNIGSLGLWRTAALDGDDAMEVATGKSLVVMVLVTISSLSASV